jgi:DNA processing protein
MSEPRACPDCLRRSWLLADLGPYIERSATGVPGSRAPELLRLSNEDLVEVVAPKAGTELIARVEALSERRLTEELAAAGCWASCRHGDPYPSSLRDAADAPWALIGRGDPGLLAGLEPFGAVTIVGARRATSYGREIARELGRTLAAAGMVVVSGLAFGVDACAHRGALDAGRTIAVLGCGADVAYPASHRSLWRRICEQGLVISELPPGAAPWRWTFPARNRIMAALAGMTVVVEAAVRSGSLITADLAADLGRDLGAVPGPVTSRASAGPNNLLAGGACVVRDAQDVLDALFGAGAKSLERSGPGLDTALAAALAAVDAGESSCDGVAAALALPGSQAAAALARLELLGYVICSPMGLYSRTLQAPPTVAPSRLPE